MIGLAASKNSERLERLWLYAGLFLVISMVIVGGITRLTCSGLSIVDWRPVTGIIPPLSQADWQHEFLKYQGSPEYKILNSTMGLQGFKQIFFWEYLHRLIGRLIGIIFLLPFIGFAMAGKLDRQKTGRYLLIFSGGLLQGLAGWYMVKSGLIKDPHVSHFRLAIHFFLMLLIIGLILREIYKMEEGRWKREEKGNRKVRILLITLNILVLFQLLYGAFTAGLKAGYGFNTWPLMDNEFFPSSVAGPEALSQLLLYNGAVVQFIHRWLGAGIVILSFILSFSFVKTSSLRRPYLLFMGLLILQALLGIITLLSHVQIGIAVWHQLNGVLIFISLARLNLKVFSAIQLPKPAEVLVMQSL